MKPGDFVTQARRTDWPFVARVERVHPIPSGTDPTHFASIKLEGGNWWAARLLRLATWNEVARRPR